MLEDGLIRELDQRPARGDDERRRYHRITPLGRKVAAAEATRMSELVAQAQAIGLRPQNA